MFSTLQDSYFVTALQACSPARTALNATMKQEGSWTSVSDNQNSVTLLMVFPPQLSSPEEFIPRGMLGVSGLKNVQI